MEMEEKNKNKIPENVPIYFSNNVYVGLTLSEMVISFSLGGVLSQIVYISLPVAKTLRDLIDSSIKDYEQKSGQTVLSLEELVNKVNSNENEESS